MIDNVPASSAFEASVAGYPSGLYGTLTVSLEDGVGNVITAPRLTGITESLAAPGTYFATLLAPAVAGQYYVIWDPHTTGYPTAPEEVRVIAVGNGTNRYTNSVALKAFTASTDLKAADDDWLNTNLIPRAEAWLQAFGPFVSEDCPQLALAANMLAEAIYGRIPTGSGDVPGGMVKKSESIGNYSYTLGAIAEGGEGGTTEWDLLLQEIGLVLGPCLLTTNMILFASDQVFTPVPGYQLDSVGGRAKTFSVEEETEILRGYLDRVVWR